MRHRLRVLARAATVTVLAFGLLGTTAATTGADVAPNGRVAYSSWDDAGNYDIYVVDPATPEVPPVRLTTDGRYNSNPDWSPDGTRIVYDGWASGGGPRIQVMDADPATDDWTILSDPCTEGGCYGDFQPAWSPDGTRIAFISSRPNADGSENWSYEVYVMGVDGEVGSLPQAIRLTTDALPEFGQSINDSQVTWSPDGQRLAFLSSGRGDGPDSCDLWVMDAQDLDGDGFGDNLSRLTSDNSFNCDPFEDVSPQWAPNSSLIAFTSVRSGYFDIWLVNADDPTDLRNVTRTPEGYEDQPSWSPDGTQIIYRGIADGAYEFFSLPVPPPAPEASARGAAAPAARPQPTQLTFDGENKQQADWGRAVGRAPRTLTVTKAGLGHVRSTPAGISCGSDCTETYTARTTVTLTATPGAGHQFVRWSGACRGTTPTCTVTVARATSVAARFSPLPPP